MISTEGEEINTSHELEDGELEKSDVEEGIYIPLRRPDNFHPLPAVQNMQLHGEFSEDSHPETSSDSGSDSDRKSNRPKKAKVRLAKLQVQNPAHSKKKKYDIWNKPLQDEVLTEELLNCDVSKNRRYGVESYDHAVKYRLNNDSKNEEKHDSSYQWELKNKRSSFDRKNAKLRLGGCDKFTRKDETSRKHVSENKRILDKLNVTGSSSVEEVAADIADKLKEAKVSLVLKIVQAIGSAKAMEVYNETKRIEADGGVLVLNGRRRRTSGGVFFFILKKEDDIRSIVESVFALENENIKKERKDKKTIATNKSSEPKRDELSCRSNPSYHDQLADYRMQKVEELKKTLTDADLPRLCTRAEVFSSPPVGDALPLPSTPSPSPPPPALSNPPPSPATDTEASASTRLRAPSPQLYQEDFLDINAVDDMDLF